MSATDALDTHWRELVTAALLGTERRSPPRPPVALVADVVDDGVPPDDAARMLATVSAVIAARRAAFVPLPPADRLQPPAQADTRPMTPPAASATWREIVGRMAGARGRVDADRDRQRLPARTRCARGGVDATPHRSRAARPRGARRGAAECMVDRPRRPVSRRVVDGPLPRRP